MRRIALNLMILLSPLGVSRADVDPAALSGAIEKAQEQLIRLQRDEGCWAGDIHLNPRETAYYIVTVGYLGLEGERARVRRSARWLLEHQGSDGGWGFFDRGGEGDVSITAVCALALDLAGVSASAPSLIKAREFVDMHGGLNAVDPFAKTFHALCDRHSWDDQSINPLPIEMLLAPRGSSKSIYGLPAWIREAAVPTMILQVLNASTSTPSKQAGLREAEQWIVTHQLEDGAWFTELPTCLSMIALAELDLDRYYPRIKRGLDWLHSKQDADGYQRRFELSVWDTALAATALRESGIPASDHVLAQASQWLLGAQTRAGGKLWSNVPSGGWSYNKFNIIYPDNDDTALALIALQGIVMKSFPMEYQKTVAIETGKRWLQSMQNDDGGWATFSRNQAERHFASAPSGFEDPSVADIAGHVLSAFGRLGYKRGSPAVRRAIDFLKRDQTGEGAWYGRWGLCYLYGTSTVLMALYDVGEEMNEPYVRKAVKWLISHQNGDGGWGERFAAWDPQGFTATKMAESTVEQTAWATMALLSARESPDSRAIERGISYILNRQQTNGGWATEEYTVLGLNPYRNTLYPIYWPLMALGLYAQARQVPVPFHPDGESVSSRGGRSTSEAATDYGSLLIPTDLPSNASGRAEFQIEVRGASGRLRGDRLGSNAAGPWVRLRIHNVGTDEASNLVFRVDGTRTGRPLSHQWPAVRPGEDQSIEFPVGDLAGPETRGPFLTEVFFEWTDSLGEHRSQASTVSIDLSMPLKSRSTLMSTMVRALPPSLIALAAFLLWRGRFIRPVLLRYSFDALRRNKLRTALTILGMIVGVGAISGTLSLGLSFQDRLARDFRSFGTGRILVLPYEMQIQIGPPVESVGGLPSAKFDEQDVAMIRALPNVEAASPVIHAQGTATFQGRTTDLDVELVDPRTFAKTTPLELDSGRFLAEGDTCHLNLGYAVAHEAFDDEVTDGLQITIGGKTYQVVGIFKNVGGVRGRLRTLVSPDVVSVAPLSVASAFTTKSYYDAIEVRVADEGQISRSSERILELLQKRHQGEQCSTLYTEKLQAKVAVLLRQFNIIIVSIGFFSLLVSGVCIMNTILVSVTERTTEIGILKALGAKNGTILGIFLAEAAALGVVGGTLGCLMGGLVLLGVQFLADLYAPFNTVLLFASSLAIALAVAIASAAYPAMRASRLDPATALRQG